MKSVMKAFIIACVVGMSATAAAEQPRIADNSPDLDRRSSAENPAVEERALRIFRGVFAQCRDVRSASASGATISIIFEVQPDGSFGATATFEAGEASRDDVRQLAHCMGTRANQSTPFPSVSSTTFVGAKFTMDAEEKDGRQRLILGEGQVSLLDGSRLFSWGRPQS